MTAPTTIRTPQEVRSIIRQRMVNRIHDARKRPTVRVWDKDWNMIGLLVGEIEGSFEERLNDTGEGMIRLFGDHKFADWMIREVAEAEDIHMTVDSPGKRWSGKVRTISDRQTAGGFEYVEVKLLHDYEHLKKIICYSNPLLPPEFQWPKIWMWAGPSIFGIKTLIFLNLLRRFTSMWSLPENIFDANSWKNNLNPANWPIVIVPGNFFTDTSMWTVLTTRFGNLHDVIQPTLKDAGLHLTVTRWLPGDAQPAPTHFTLTKPTLVLDIIDKSGVRGPSGTALDGLLKLGAHILEDGVSEVISILEPGTPPEEYDRPGYLGTVNTAPYVSWRNGMKTGLTGITEWEMTIHKALAGAVVTGGKSPDWVNSGIKLLINGVLGYIGMIFGNPALALGIFDSQVEDVILAFHRVPHNIRQSIMGSNQYGEHWENTGGTGFSVAALQAVRIGMWKTRAYTSFKFNVTNGAPYWIGRHFDLGDRVSAEIGKTNRLYVDQICALRQTWSRTEDPKWEISLGDDTGEEMPGAFLGRQVEHLRALVQSLGTDS